jgi:DNA-binding MarR family transcriptional regulator
MRAAPPRYRDNLARHLIGISRDLQARVRDSPSERGHRGLRPSFGPLLSLVRDEGRPLSALAAELAVSSQAAGQLVKVAEAGGYLTRRPNPADRRSKLVAPTARGRALIEDGVEIILASEADYAARVGEPCYRRFTRALATLLRATSARGHLKMAFGQVLPLIGPEGGRVHEIARVQRVSRQAISAICHELEALGHPERRADPRDRRGVVLVLSRAGKALIRDSVAAQGVIDERFRAILGVRRFGSLEQVARDPYHALRLEAEIFEVGPNASALSHDVPPLASRLRRRLGRGDAKRLAVLLGRRAEEVVT